MDVDPLPNGDTGSESRRVTAVVLNQGEGISKSAKGKVIWLWTGDDANHETITVCAVCQYRPCHALTRL